MLTCGTTNKVGTSNTQHTTSILVGDNTTNSKVNKGIQHYCLYIGRGLIKYSVVNVSKSLKFISDVCDQHNNTFYLMKALDITSTSSKVGMTHSETPAVFLAEL